jgi:hypothetical protein
MDSRYFTPPMVTYFLLFSSSLSLNMGLASSGSRHPIPKPRQFENAVTQFFGPYTRSLLNGQGFLEELHQHFVSGLPSVTSQRCSSWAASGPKLGYFWRHAYLTPPSGPSLEQFHYLGRGGGTVGENLHYRVSQADDRMLAGLWSGSAAWKCGTRDQFIGWTVAGAGSESVADH